MYKRFISFAALSVMVASAFSFTNQPKVLAASSNKTAYAALTDSDSMKGEFVNIIPGDFNGDGFTDFIRQEKGAWSLADSNNTAELYLAATTGTPATATGAFTKSALTDNPDYFKGELVNIIPGDFNGDGFTDFIRQEKDAWDNDDSNTADLFLASKTTLGTFTKSTLTDSNSMKGDLVNIIPGDFNGDGNTDFIRQEKGDWVNDDVNTADLYVYKASDNTFTKLAIADQSILKGGFVNIIPGDFKGSIDTDATPNASDKTYTRRGSKTGISFIAQKNNESKAYDNEIAYLYTPSDRDASNNVTFTKTVLANSNDLKGDFVNIIPGDFNGDGKTDFIRQEKGSATNDSYRTAELYVARAITTPASTNVTEVIQDGAISNKVRNIAAANDPVVNVPTIGSGTFSVKKLASGLTADGDKEGNAFNGNYVNIIPGDFNGDGKTDFIRQEKGAWANDDVNTAQLYTANTTTSTTFDKGVLVPPSAAIDVTAGVTTSDSKNLNGDNTFTVTDLSVPAIGTIPPSGSQEFKGDYVNIIPGDFKGQGKLDLGTQNQDDKKDTGLSFIRQEKNAWSLADSNRTADVYTIDLK